MSVLVYIENTEGKLKKGTLEAVSYAVEFGKAMGSDVVGVSIGEISNEVCTYPFITSLELQGNQLTGTIPDCIGGLSSLTNLRINNNHCRFYFLN